MTQEIKDGNKLIAEFMGMVEQSENFWVNKSTGEGRILGDYSPHSDWNELMPVVEKIEQPGNFPDGSIKEGVGVYINYKNCRVEYSDDDRSYEESLRGERGETKILKFTNTGLLMATRSRQRRLKG